MLKKMKIAIQEIGILSLSFSIAFVVVMGISIAKGWTEPTQAPPAGNLGAPVNTSAFEQTKAGFLNLTAGGAYGGGGVGMAYHSLNSNANGWLYLGDQGKGVFGSRGLAAGNLYSANTAYFANGSGSWGSDNVGRAQDFCTLGGKCLSAGGGANIPPCSSLSSPCVPGSVCYKTGTPPSHYSPAPISGAQTSLWFCTYFPSDNRGSLVEAVLSSSVDSGGGDGSGSSGE